MAKLTPRQAAFVSEYLKDLNATQAAIRAGYSKKTAAVIAVENLKKPNVAAAIQEAQHAREIRTAVTQDRVVAELAKIAFGDGTAYARVVTRVDPETLEDYETVELTPTSKLTPDQRAAVAQIKEGRHGIEVSRYDKMKALELLGRHLGMFDNREPEQQETEDDGFLEALREGAADAWQD